MIESVTITAPARSLVTGGDPDASYNVPREDRFKSRPGRRKPDLDFIDAPDIAETAAALIERHGSRFGHLRGQFALRVAYRWKRAGGVGGGKATLGKCVKASGLLLAETGTDFYIWLGADHCEYFSLTAYQVEALVFHELLHTGDDDARKAKIRPHQFEGFIPELEVYGAWSTDLDLVGRAMQQLRLPLDAANGNGHGEL